MRRYIGIAAAALLFASPVAAQESGRYAVELRGGAAFPTADLADATLKMGGGFQVGVIAQFLGNASLYAGWDWHLFQTDKPFAGVQYDVNETGYAFGIQIDRRFSALGGAWVRAGGTYNHIELEADDGELSSDSGHDLGWEAGAGMRIPVTNSIVLLPGLRYRTLSTDLHNGVSRVAVELSYLTTEIGVAWTPGGHTQTRK